MNETVQRVNFGPIVYDATSEGGYVYRFDYNREETIANLMDTYAEFERMMQRIAEVMRPAIDEFSKAVIALGLPIRPNAVTARVGKRRVQFAMRRDRWRVT